MGEQNKSKESIIRYFNAIRSVAKTRELLEEFTADEELMNHIAFLDPYFRSTKYLPMR